MQRRLATRGWILAAGVAVFALAARTPQKPPVLAQKGVASWSLRTIDVPDEETQEPACGPSMGEGLVLPTGAPAALTCDAARTIVAQVRNNMAADAGAVDAAKFADGAVDWLDPHGLWSVAPDAPIAPLLRREKDHLLSELEASPSAGACVAADVVGAALAAWTKVLRGSYDEGVVEGRREDHAPRTLAEVWRTISSAPFEDGPITRSGRDLAHELGREVGVARLAYGDALEPYAAAASKRFFPELGEDGWARVVMAASVRAYVPQIDVHGAWAPLEEETSIYDLDLETNPPLRLWTEMTRTALGVRVDGGALAPLLDGDIVLAVRGVPIAGMSVEQAAQSAIIADAPEGQATQVVVLRPQVGQPLTLVVTAPASRIAGPPPEPPALPLDIVRYGDGHVAVIAIADVPDDLGERVGAALSRARQSPDLRGVLLDMRANPGGSTEGAISAVGHFLPGAALFPMRRRDGNVEIDRAPDIAPDQRWTGALAVLVDGDSASAAEMIAGAIGSYHRGVVVGDKTYGKGCAQEYLDDDARAGVLRLTTLMFCLPDGAPVQKTGLFPQIALSLPAAAEREARVTRALPAWRGPDVRDPALMHEVPWSSHGGRVGPCKDEIICRALRVVGASVAAAR